jgi:DNA primase
MNAKQAKSVPLEDILQRYGCEPRERKGTDLWYQSPFREERTASFVVNTTKNVWYDHGEGAGGTTIDLVSRLANESDIGRVLAIIAESVGRIVPAVDRATRQKEDGRDIRASKVQERDLTHPALSRYLGERGVNADYAQRYIREIRYESGDKQYFGIAFPNRSGGYEVRNPYFKGSVGTKDISVVPKDGQGAVNLFEGFMDFLSWPALAGERDHTQTAVVLNSVSLVDRAIAYLQEHPFSEIRTFFDRDSAGRTATARIREAFPSNTVVDMSERYRDSIDVNAALMRQREARRAELQKAIDQGQ